MVKNLYISIMDLIITMNKFEIVNRIEDIKTSSEKINLLSDVNVYNYFEIGDKLTTNIGEIVVEGYYKIHNYNNPDKCRWMPYTTKDGEYYHITGDGDCIKIDPKLYNINNLLK